MTPKTDDLKRAARKRLRPLLPSRQKSNSKALACRRTFLKFFPGGFADETYLESERNYKWEAYERWCAALRRNTPTLD